MDSIHSDPVRAISDSSSNVSAVLSGVRAGSVPYNFIGEFGYSLLIKASEKGYFELVREILKHADANINHCTMHGDSALSNAARFGHIDIAMDLIAAGADLEVRSNEEGYTPYHYAVAESKKLDLVRALEISGANVRTVSNKSRTTLMTAVVYGHRDIFLHVLNSSEIDIDARDSHDSTALHLAVSKGNYEFSQVLVESGASILCVNKLGWTLLSLCAEYGWEQLNEYLLSFKQIDVNQPPTTDGERNLLQLRDCNLISRHIPSVLQAPLL
jgi:ankyrin repeat protein